MRDLIRAGRVGRAGIPSLQRSGEKELRMQVAKKDVSYAKSSDK